VRDVAVSFLERHPELRHYSAAALVAWALAEAFPCKPQGLSRGKAVPVEPEPSDITDKNIVAGAQEGLRQLGFDPGPVDGIEGPKTRAAVRAFEKARGLPETGRISPELIQELSNAFYEMT
jgi:hypothetical protein